MKSRTGVGLFPSDELAAAFVAGLTAGDPVAERFVAETHHGSLGPQRSRELVEPELIEQGAAVWRRWWL